MKKLSKTEEGMDFNKREEGVDRISNLPDSLIHHILSFLKIKHVAQTSVLSKKWSYIWITVPILDFHDWGCFEPTDMKTNEFMDFVDGTLLRRYSGANIQRFSITWHKHLNVNRVNSWITFAVRHNVQHLLLYLVQNEPLILTRSFESMISLKLQISPNVHFPNYISFPKLKRLELGGVDFSNENWNEKLFSNCPVLEYFDIEHSTWFGMPNFCISTPALKHFQIDNWDEEWIPRGEDDGLRGCTLKIHAPNLETLDYYGCVAKEYVLSTFPLLVKAAVQFRFIPYAATREQRIGHGEAISQFFRALANVKHLYVSDDTLQALSFSNDLLEKLPTCHNAKKLTIFDEVTDDKALVALLQATPNLESLVFNKSLPPISDDEEEDDDTGSDDEEEDDDTGSDASADAAEGENNHAREDAASGNDADVVAVESEDYHGSEDNDWTLNVTDPEFLFLHLKSVSFREFIGTPVDMRWLKLILKNAKALQTVSISNCYHSYLLKKKRKEELMVEIQSLARVSTSCVFKFSSFHCRAVKGVDY
ncbi:hypothetical protein MKW92_025027 [Papaver armeniacum]|nr:hypothetical protein MKW92_025027 [Papaver armeniacum]